MHSLKSPSLLGAWAPIVLTLGLLTYQLRVAGGGPPHVPIIFGIAITAVLGSLRGHRWGAMEKAMAQAVGSAVPVMGIMLTVGLLIGTWILCGTVPWLTLTALALLDPAFFLPVACLACAMVSLLVGTSWGTVGTLGLALLGAGESLGIPAPMTAGAVVSGAWFGDKLSPLSDSTNFSAAMVGTDLYAHIRNLLPTTLPAFLVALGAYGLLGQSTGGALDDSTVALLRATLESHFVFHPLLALPPAVVLAAALLRVPALPGIFSGVIAGALVAWLIQDATVATLLRTLMEGYQPATGEPLVDTLLAKGGLLSMTWVILLIFVSMIFGGLLEATGCLDRILNALIHRLHSRFRLFTAAFLSTLGINVASNIFVTLAVNGRLFAPVFRGAGYSSVNLSRTLEDGGTLSSPLIPWNAGGLFVTSTLGVPTLLYAPFAIANWFAMVLDLLYAALGRFMPRADAAEIAQWRRDQNLLFHEGQLMTADALPPNTFAAERTP